VSEIRVLVCSRSYEGALSVCMLPSCPCVLTSRKRARNLSRVSFRRTLIPSPNIITIEIKFSHMNLRGTQTFSL
jgi:hypothetical protein